MGYSKKAIDFLCEHSCDSKIVYIGFYGGEPLLAFPLLQKCVQYAKQRLQGHTIRFTMTSNGTLLTEEIVAFCNDNEVGILLSIDGSKEAHDKNRIFAHDNSGTFDTIMSKVRMVKEKFPTFMNMIQFNMVNDPTNDFDCSKNVFFDYEAIDKHNTYSTLIDSMLLDKQYMPSSDFFIKYEYDLFLGLLHEIGRIDNSDVSPLTYRYYQNVKSRTKRMFYHPFELSTEMAPGGPCFPGGIRAMIDINGKIFPCERCSESSPAMHIGSIDKGFDIPRVNDMLNVGAIESDTCKNCWAILHCTCCAARIDDGTKLSAQIKLRNCASIQAQVEMDMLNMIIVYESRHIESHINHDYSSVALRVGRC